MTEAPEDSTAAPAIVLVAVAHTPAALVLPPNAELGRRVAAAGATHELADERMSRDHATVRWDRGVWTVTDLDSRNGTYVDGERIRGEHRVKGDAIVRLGHTVFLLVADGRGHPVDDSASSVVGPELGRVYDQLRRYAAHGADALLIHGEPGSGKELAARLFHASGPRAHGPFVAVNCAAIPEGVADRLLFGGKKGLVETIGQMQLARGGTLWLDELADLDAVAQQRLARVLEDGPPGLAIAGGSHEMRSAVADGRFREDLYQRLARVSVEIPPLRARKVDIARLVQREIAETARRVGRPLVAHPKLIESCCLRYWPGNVRELRATLKHAASEALAHDRDAVRVEDLGATAGLVGGTSSGETAVERPRTGDKSAAALDRVSIVDALARANGVISIAARALGLHRSQLYRLLEEHGISRDDG